MNHRQNKLTDRILMLFLFVAAIFGIDCGNSSSDNANAGASRTQSNAVAENAEAKDDVAELLTLVRLPEVPEEVVWREEPAAKSDANAANSSNRKITAVLKYDEETAARLAAQIGQNQKTEAAEIGAENWFPEELIAQTQISGNEMLKGTAYPANDFFNAPYGSGKITRIESTNYFVLELFAA